MQTFLLENEKKVFKYLFVFFLTYTAFVISLSLKKGYQNFNGIPLYVYVILFSLLALIGIIDLFAKKKRKQTESI